MTTVTLPNVKLQYKCHFPLCTLFTGQTIQIRYTGPGISYLLRLVIFVYRYCWNVVLSEWEVDDLVCRAIWNSIGPQRKFPCRGQEDIKMTLECLRWP
jgi:hypothetical protein